MSWWEFTEFRERGVPFAVDAQGVWRGVDEVPRGRACGCVCPDCRGPVIARHGEVRAHHFAHDDRRECRHALEASLFGMAIRLLSAPTAVLRLPPADLSELAPDLAVSPEDLELLNLPALLARGTIRLPDAVARTTDFHDSSPDAPDIVVPSLRLAIHLLSHRKTMQQAKAAARGREDRVLGLNLRNYVQTWWATCDAERDAKVRVLTEARGAMQEWIGSQSTGRGWLRHPELEAAARELDERIRRERAERAAALARERAAAAARELARQHAYEEQRRHEAAEEANRRRAADERWKIAPPAEAAGAAEAMKAVTIDAENWLTPSLAVNYGVRWHRTRRRYFYVGRVGEIVAEAAREVLAREAPWEFVSEADRTALETIVSVGRFAPADDWDETAVGEDRPIADAPDEVLRATEQKCWCGALQHEVRLGRGFYAGRKVLRCSANERHPIRLLGPE